MRKNRKSKVISDENDGKNGRKRREKQHKIRGEILKFPRENSRKDYGRLRYFLKGADNNLSCGSRTDFTFLSVLHGFYLGKVVFLGKKSCENL